MSPGKYLWPWDILAVTESICVRILSAVRKNTEQSRNAKILGGQKRGKKERIMMDRF